MIDRAHRASGTRVRCMLAVALLSACATPAFAVEPLDQFSARIGGFLNRFDTEVRVDGESREGTDIDLGRDLNLDPDNTVGFVAVTWRPFERHEFGLSYFNDNASSRRQLDRDIVFDDQLYEASATVGADYDVDAYELSYTWWGVSREDWALGPRVGMMWYQIDLGVSLELDANGDPVAGGGVERRASADLPAPSIGASARWTPGEDWRLVGEVGYFSTTIDDVDVDVTYGRAGIEWHPWERVGLMLDYTHSNIDAETDKSRFDGAVDLTNSGTRLGIVFRY